MGVIEHTFFYSNNRGIGVLANLFSGAFQEQEISEPQDWSQIVEFNEIEGSDLFFYSNNSGTGAVGHVYENGEYVQSDLVPGFNKNWSHIVPITSVPLLSSATCFFTAKVMV